MAESSNKESEAPHSRDVSKFHTNADTDSSTDAIHHTLGRGANQAASGGHNHRDGNGAPILFDVALTGSKTGTNSTVLISIVAALVALGAEDKTT